MKSSEKGLTHPVSRSRRSEPRRPAFAFDPSEAVAHLQKADPVLAALIRRVGPFGLELTPAKSLFEALLRSIVYQQLHGKAAATIHGRVLAAMAGHGGPTPAALSSLSDNALRSAGLSRAKLLALRDLASKCADGLVPTVRQAAELADEALMTQLTQVRGIGPWTVQMLLIFYLGRPDVLPTGDFAIRLAFKQLYGKRAEPSPDTIIRHARCWQPYRSVASWYLWRHLDPT